MADQGGDPRLEALDPATTGGRLAELAAAHPELGELVARHPQVYPGLLDWLAEYGDAAAQIAVADVRSTASAVAYPVATPAAAAPVASAATATPASPWDSTSAATAVPAPPRPPRTPRRRLLIGLIAGGVALLLVVGGVTWAVFGAKFLPSPTPQAAAEKLIGAITDLDFVAMGGSLAPSEISRLTPSFDRLTGIDVDTSGTDYGALLNRLHAALTVTRDGLEYETTELAEGVSLVELTDGTITIDGDATEIAELYVDALKESQTATFEQYGMDKGEIEDALNDTRDSIRDSLKDTFPIEINADEARDNGPGFRVVTVSENGGWYVSPLLTAAEYTITGSEREDLRGDHVVDGKGFASPEEAAEGTANAVTDFLSSGDSDELAAVLPLAERRLVSLYGPAYGFGSGGFGDSLDFEFTNLDFSAEQVDAGTARVTIDGLAFQSYDSSSETTLNFSLDGTCWDSSREYYDYWYEEWQTDSSNACLEDALGANGKLLGLDELKLITVQEDGRWYLSPLATLADASAIVTQHYAKLSQEDRLDELYQAQG